MNEDIRDRLRFIRKKRAYTYGIIIGSLLFSTIGIYVFTIYKNVLFDLKYQTPFLVAIITTDFVD